MAKTLEQRVQLHRDGIKRFVGAADDWRTKKNPGFPVLVEEAQARRELLRMLASERAAQALSQTTVAASMGTSQSSLARLESGASDAKLSTVERMATALGLKIQFRLVAAETDVPAVVRG